jgi:hypothetical protein
MIKYCNITGFNETITGNTPVIKLRGDNFIFIIIITKTTYIIPIKLCYSFRIMDVDFNITNQTLSIKYNWVNDEIKFTAPLCTTEIIFNYNNKLIFDSLTYKDNYYYDLYLYEDLNNLSKNQVKELSKYLNIDTTKIMFENPVKPSDDESEEENDTDYDEEDYY